MDAPAPATPEEATDSPTTPAAPPGPTTVLRGHASSVHDVAFVGNSHLVAGDDEGQVWLWSCETRRPCVKRPDAHDGAVFATLWDTEGGSRVISQARDGRVQVWGGLEDGDMRPEGVVETGTISFCRCAVAGDALASTGQSPHRVGVWSLQAEEITHVLGMGANGETAAYDDPDARGMCMALCFVDAHTLAVGYEAGQVTLWDLRRPSEPIAEGPSQHTEPVMAMAAVRRPDGGSPVDLVTGGADDVLARTRFAPAEADPGGAWAAVRKGHRTATITNAGVQGLAVHASQKVMASAGWDARVRVWSTKKMRPLAVLQYHTGGVNAVAFPPVSPLSPDLPWLVSAGKDGRIALWPDLFPVLSAPS